MRSCFIRDRSCSISDIISERSLFIARSILLRGLGVEVRIFSSSSLVPLLLLLLMLVDKEDVEEDGDTGIEEEEEEDEEGTCEEVEVNNAEDGVCEVRLSQYEAPHLDLIECAACNLEL